MEAPLQVPVIDLDSSDEDAASPPAKRPRTGSPAQQQQQQQQQQQPLRGAPLHLNRLLEVGVACPMGVELSLQDIFEQHPSAGGRPPREALVANFMVDLAFLMDECPSLQRVPRLTVMVGDDGCGCGAGATRERDRQGLETLVHKPPLPLQWGTHHSKLALLLYDDCVRVCVRTFNDICADVHRKSQALYVQDFPARVPAPGGPESRSAEADAFGADFDRQLKRYLQCCGGFDPSRLDPYDFSSAAVALVASCPGYHKGREVEEWGHARLRRVLSRGLNLPPEWRDVGTEEGLICQFSSLGSLTPKWLQEFHASLMGASTPAAPSSGSGFRPPLHLVVPTASQVRDSGEGWAAGASVPIRSANLKDWLQPHWRRWGPAAGSADRGAAERARTAMPHVKSYCRYAARHGGTPRLAWLYIGSHNLSRAAWGELQKGCTQLCIRSYELGVVVLPGRLRALEPDLERPRGRFLRRRPPGAWSTGPAVLVPLAASYGTSEPSVAEVPVACPTAVPPGEPPSAEDPVWAVDLPGERLERLGGLDRFGTRAGERQVAFYGHHAQRRVQAGSA